jgi:hypothetical protein
MRQGLEASPSEDTVFRRTQRELFECVIRTFLYYEIHGLEIISKTKLSYSRLPASRHHCVLAHLPAKFQKWCLDANQRFLGAIVEHVHSFVTDLLVNSSTLLQEVQVAKRQSIRSVQGLDMEKIRCKLPQFVRDWSEDDTDKRKQCYAPIIDALQSYYSN